MPRKVPEWKGKNDDTRVPARVKARVFDRYNGRDYITGQKIRPGDRWECDHERALCNGGKNTESNLRPILSPTHKAKTPRDRKLKAKTDRTKQKHIGITKPKTPKGNLVRGVDGIVRDRETREPV